MQGVAMHRRVLIVDDFADITSTLAELVALLGHRVCVANRGEDALDLAREFRPDLVLLDLCMPGIDGFEVARRLRAAPEGQLMELIAISGWGHTAARERAIAAGFDRHFLKPITLAHLHALLAAPKLQRATPQ
jgi:CheY-like chemotaxis protein